jgi:hypothetical protein
LNSISSRQALAKAANIERLMKKNKARDSPFKTMIEVMTFYFIEQFSTDKQPSHSHTQKPSQKLEESQPVTSSQMSRPQFDHPQPLTSQTSHPSSTPLKYSIQLKSDQTPSDKTEKSTSNVKKEFQAEGNRQLLKQQPRAILGGVMSTGHGQVGERRDTRREKGKRKTDKPLAIASETVWDVEFGGSGIQAQAESKVESSPGLVDGERRKSGIEMVGRRPRNVDVKEGSVGGLVCEDIEDEEVGGVAFHYQPTVSFGLRTQGQPLDIHTAVALKTLLFGSGTISFNAEWQKQSFTFCDLPGLEYGLVQIKGGPCGVLASVQAYIIKHLLFSVKQSKQNGQMGPNDAERRAALCSSLVEILWKCGSMQKACIVKPSACAQFGAVPGKYKTDQLTECLCVFEFNKKSSLEQFTRENISQFENSSGKGVILFLYSALLSRGLKQVCEDMDESGHQLMGRHGYCNQEMVNLLLTGVASSNVFNNQIELDAGGSTKLVLKGIRSQSDIGFLSLFEHYGSCQVGSFLKSPTYPAWVVCSESHFSVLFSMEREILTDWKLARRFDLFYYDGLARQDEVIRLTVDTTKKSSSNDTDLIPPLEHCIRTKWVDASVDWNGSEPIL